MSSGYAFNTSSAGALAREISPIRASAIAITIFPSRPGDKANAFAASLRLNQIPELHLPPGGVRLLRRRTFFRVCSQFGINRAAGLFTRSTEPSVKGLGVRLISEKYRFFFSRTASRPDKLGLHFRLVTLQES